VANIASSKKDARRSAVRAARNRSIKSSVKTKVSKFRRAVADGAEETEQLALTAVSALDRAVSKGVVHARNAARRKSRLMKRLHAAGLTETAAPKPAAKAAAKAASKPAAKPARATKAASAAKPARSGRAAKAEEPTAPKKRTSRKSSS
jgi:small subunit ribosomal protein S20